MPAASTLLHLQMAFDCVTAHNLTRDASALGIEPANESRYSVTNIAEGADDWPSATGPLLVKRYAKGDVGLHLHLYLRIDLIGSGVDDVPRYLRLTFERLAVVGADLAENSGQRTN